MSAVIVKPEQFKSGAPLTAQRDAQSSSQAGMLAAVRDELKEKFPLRLCLYLLVGGVWLYGVLALQDAAKGAGAKLKAAQVQAARAESIAKEGDWSARALAAKDSVIDAQALLWREESAGLAQALISDQIAKSLAQARITPRLLNVANVIETKAESKSTNSTKTDVPEVMVVRAKVQFEFKQVEFYAWLESLAKARAERKPTFVVDTISVRGLPTPLVEVDLVAYVLRAKVPKIIAPPMPLPNIGGQNAAGGIPR